MFLDNFLNMLQIVCIKSAYTCSYAYVCVHACKCVQATLFMCKYIYKITKYILIIYAGVLSSCLFVYIFIWVYLLSLIEYSI